MNSDKYHRLNGRTNANLNVNPNSTAKISHNDDQNHTKSIYLDDNECLFCENVSSYNENKKRNVNAKMNTNPDMNNNNMNNDMNNNMNTQPNDMNNTRLDIYESKLNEKIDMRLNERLNNANRRLKYSDIEEDNVCAKLCCKYFWMSCVFIIFLLLFIFCILLITNNFAIKLDIVIGSNISKSGLGLISPYYLNNTVDNITVHLNYLNDTFKIETA
jgi:hypothetical protein